MTLNELKENSARINAFFQKRDARDVSFSVGLKFQFPERRNHSHGWYGLKSSQMISLNMSEKWNQEGRENSPPYEAVFANHLSIYEGETCDLPVRLHTRPIGERPFIEIAGEHLLAIEQKNGIPETRIQEIAELLSH
nr:DUF2199 domain-containing protein [Edaphobacter aggregans]